jgi:hypothetical protein
MHKYLKILVFSVFLLSCGKQFKYKIVGKLKDGRTNAIWFVTKIKISNDTAYYENDEKKMIKINPPFKIYQIKK